MRITILGNNSAIPACGRHPTAQIVEIREQLLLVDCGEGTQMQMQRYGIRTRRIHHIFISHLHGDHYFGLIGLLTSMGLLGRTEPVHLYAPPKLEDIINIQLNAAATVLPYELRFIPIEDDDSKMLINTPYITVQCFPTEHRIPCHGFVFESKKGGRVLLPEACRTYEIPAAYYARLKEGADYMQKNGELVKNEWVTSDPPPPQKYAYCADTLFTESFLSHIAGADIMYHESTYLNDLAQRARERFHSTALEAAQLAQKAGVKRLLLGHFSSKYEDLSVFEQEARSIFPATEITQEGMSFEV